MTDRAPSQTTTGAPHPQRYNPTVTAALWAVGAMLNFTVMIVLIRYVSKSLSAIDVAFYRSAIGVALMLPFVFRGGIAAGLTSLKTKRPWLHSLRGLLTYCALVTYVYAVANMKLVDAIALNATIPLWTVVLAALILSETVGPRRWLVTVLGFGGALIILRPGFAEIGLPAIAALVSAAFYGATSIVVKSLSRTETPQRIVFYTNLSLTVIAAAPAIIFWNPPTWAQVPFVIGIGVSGTLAHLCLTRAYMNADASFVAPFDFIRLVLVTIAGYALFGEKSSVWVWIGALLVMSSTIYITRAEAKRR